MTGSHLDTWFAEFRRTADPQRLAAVFDATAPELLRVARHLARDAHAAEDLVQSAFLKAIEKRDRYDPALPVLPWLLGILSNEARHERRRGGRPLPPAHDDAALSAAEDAERGERTAQLREALRGLPQPYRQVLLLRVDHGLDSRAIADVTGRKPATVRTQIARGMDLLRAALPVGTAVGLVSVTARASSRLAGVRAAVLQGAAAAAAHSGALTATTIGGWMTKQITWVAGGLVLLAAAFWWLAEPVAAPGLASGASPAAPAAAHDGTDAAIATAAEDAIDSGAGVATTRERAVAPTATLRVTVLDADSAAVADVGVYLAGQLLRPFGREGVTDAAGAVTFEQLPAGPLVVKPDRGPGRPCTLVAGANAVEIRLPAGVVVEGRVTDPSGTLAIPHAAVFALSREHHDRAQRLAIADAEGAFRLVGVTAGTRLFARAAGWQPGDPGRESVRENATDPLRLQLRVGARGHTLRGRVTAADGAPAAHAQVAIAVDEDAREFAEGLRGRERQRDVEAFLVRADANGVYATDEVPAGEVVVVARAAAGQAAGVALVTTRVTAGYDNRCDVVLHSGATLHGTVQDEAGQPLRGVALLVEWQRTEAISFEGALEHVVASAETESDEHGRYRLPGLLPGRHRVHARVALGVDLRRSARDPEDRVVTLLSGESQRLDLVVPRRGDLAVRLLAPGGEPLRGWGVWVSTEPDPTPRMLQLEAQRTDAAGRMRVADLLRDSPFCVTVFAPRPAAAGDRLIDRFPARQWRDVRVTDDELVLRLEPHELPTAAISARLVDARLAPLTGVRFELWRADWRERRRFEAPDGVVNVTALPAGTYWLQPRGLVAPSMGPFELVAGQHLDLGARTVAAPGGLRLTLQADDGGAVTAPQGRLCLPGPPGHDDGTRLRWQDGALVAPRQPPGTWRVVVWAEDLAPTVHTVDVPSGGVADLQLTGRRGFEQPFVVATMGIVEAAGQDGWWVDVQLLDEAGVLVGGVRSPTPRFTLRLARGPWTLRWRLRDGRTGSATCTVADGPEPPILLSAGD